ncbi:MAG: hypothetical protein FRX49_07190 [Trebouxia sp. A1-2]|nr:MAG: hypothetical protein FRX49_07190 [Trebouxia sp. A1-2]
MDHSGSRSDLWLVADNQGAVYLIKEVERGGKGSLKGKGEGKSGKCLLATTQGPKWPAVMSIWPAPSQVIRHINKAQQAHQFPCHREDVVAYCPHQGSRACTPDMEVHALSKQQQGVFSVSEETFGGGLSMKGIGVETCGRKTIDLENPYSEAIAGTSSHPADTLVRTTASDTAHQKSLRQPSALRMALSGNQKTGADGDDKQRATATASRAVCGCTRHSHDIQQYIEAAYNPLHILKPGGKESPYHAAPVGWSDAGAVLAPVCIGDLSGWLVLEQKTG